MINKSGLLLFKPSILQLSKESSLFIVFDVDNIQSYLFLKRCTVFRDEIFVIHFFFLLIVRKSFDIAIFAETYGTDNFLFKK